MGHDVTVRTGQRGATCSMRKRHAARGPYHLRQNSVLQGMLLGARDNVFGGLEKESCRVVLFTRRFLQRHANVLSGFIKRTSGSMGRMLKCRIHRRSHLDHPMSLFEQRTGRRGTARKGSKVEKFEGIERELKDVDTDRSIPSTEFPRQSFRIRGADDRSVRACACRRTLGRR